MNFLKLSVCATLALFFSSLTLADGHSEKLEKLYIDSGLELMINYMPRAVSQGIEKNLEWSNTPLGKKTKQLLESVYSDEGTVALDQCLAALATSPPDAARMKQVQALDELVQGTELNLEIIKIMQSAIATAANLSLPKQHQMPAEQINQQINSLIDPMRGELKAYTQSSYVCMYKPLSNGELDSFLSELEQPHADRFYQAMVKGIRQAFFNSSFAFGKSVAEISRQLEDQNEI